MQPRRLWLVVAALGASHVSSGAVANLIPPDSRALVMLCLTTTLSMIATAFSDLRPRKLTAAVVAATVLSILILYAWRRRLDPMAALGPVPPSLEPVALAVLGVINVVAAAAVALVFSASHRTRRFRWFVLGATATVLLVLCAIASMWTGEAMSPLATMRRVVMLEQIPDRSDWGVRQELSAALAVLGRQREAREIPRRPDAVGHRLSGVPDVPDSKPPFIVAPWRGAVFKIAAEQRLVLMMEDHAVTEHRAWIEQTLPSYRAAGFTHYCAEAIAESRSMLKSRGYPTFRTGTYTLDPRFGNLLRTAIRLGFEVGGYDLAAGDFDKREEGQAAAIAERFASRSGCRMVVHAGHGHVFRHEVRNVGRYMAARLREKTGVEPFTIWQLSNELPNDVYRELIGQLGPITEPVMLAPPPRHVSEALFPESSVHPAVDAIVVHPPRLGQEPADRRGAFSDHLTRVPGVWLGSQWPVVIAAVREGESGDAVALDQIMLRSGESAFELWLPQTDWSIRAWSLDGPLAVHANVGSSPLRVTVIR